MKINKTSFKFFNDTGNNIIFIHEPECFEFILPPNEEIIIETDCCEQSIILRQSIEKGEFIVSILDEKSIYKVYHNGIDIFDKFM